MSYDSFEKSKGKARPSLPRMSDVGPMPVSDAAAQRTAGRDASGRFTSRNACARGKGAKRALARLMGAKDSDDPAVAAVASAARVTASAYLRELPDDGTIVSGLVVKAGRHDALFAFFMAEADRHGLGSEKGMAALEEASKHGARSERLMASALTAAKSLAAARQPARNDPLAAFMPDAK